MTPVILMPVRIRKRRPERRNKKEEAKMVTTRKNIEKALEDGHFTLHYQPKVSFLTGSICGAEALLRWEDPVLGMIPPDEFIPVAEREGLIAEITAHIFPMAVRALQTLKGDGFDGSIAVNTSPLDFISGHIPLLIQDCLAHKQILPSDIQIELTETARVGDDRATLSHLYDLTSMGVPLIMDDFGTGYSSLDLLSQLPFSALKIDQGVIRRMAGSTKNLNIVNMMINVARTLRMHVVAEGIEDHHAYRFLACAGCMEAQGYWISKPLPFEEFKILVRGNPRWPSTHLGMIYHAQMNNAYFRKSVLDALLYASCGVKEEMASVTKPDIQFDPEKTRLGQWYYGAGQELNGKDRFKAIEAPHRRMHEIGELLFKNAYAGNSAQTEKLILKFNQAFEDVNRQLHLLEAALIAEEPCKKWQETGNIAKTG